MKLVIDDGVRLYLNNLYLKKTNINDRFEVKKIISKIFKMYGIDLYGYMDVKIYTDNNYGSIIEIKKDLEYFDYFKDEVEMNIEIIEDKFLYKLNDIEINNKNGELYKYDDMIYLYVKEINDIKLGKIIENSEIIYGNMAKNIIDRNNRIEVIL